MARVLVSGGCGFLGERLCDRLVREGHQVLILDNLSTGDSEVPIRLRERSNGNLEAEIVDCCDVDLTERAFKSFAPDIAFHLAAYVDAPESMLEPIRYYRNNVGATLGFLAGAASSRCRRLVLSSSAAVYGVSEEPVSEKSKLKPVSPYAHSKAMSEQIFTDVARVVDGGRVTILRYFNPVGAVPRRAAQGGRHPTGSLPLFARICRVAYGIEPVLKVYAAAGGTHDGSCVRDFIHIDDLVDAHMAVVMPNRFHGQEVEIFNVGCGRGYSVNEVVDTFERVTGQQLSRICAPPRPGDVSVSVADVGEITSKVGWHAMKGLDEMCRDTWEHFVLQIRASGD